MNLLPQERRVLWLFEREFGGLAWMTRKYLEARLYGSSRRCPQCGAHVEFKEGADRGMGALYRCPACGGSGEARRSPDMRWSIRTLDSVLSRLLGAGRLVRIPTRRGPVYTLPGNTARFPGMERQVQSTRAWGRKAVYVPLATREGVRPLRIVFGGHPPGDESSWECLGEGGSAFIATVGR